MRFLALIFILFTSTSIQAATRTVCQTGGAGAQYTTITAALAAAVNGDVVQICSGTYNESLTISQSSLTVQGAAGATVTITNNNRIFDITGSNVTIQNLTLNSSGSDAIATEFSAIGSHTFQNLTISASNYGINVANGSAHTFRQINIITSTKGIAVAWNADAGHVFDNVTVNSDSDGIDARRGASSMKTVNVTSQHGFGILVGNKYAAIFDSITVRSLNEGLHIINQDSVSPTMTLNTLNIQSVSSPAINIERSGTLTMSGITAQSQGDNAIVLGYAADGPHVLSGITVTGTGTGDIGLLATRGLSSLTIANITANGEAVEIGNKYSMTINGLIAKSSSDTAINFTNTGDGVNADYVLKNITINGAGGMFGDGIAFATANSVTADNICIKSVNRYGVNASWNTSNVSIKNSIFNGNADYGVYLGTNPVSVGHVNNSCFYQAPCAYASSTAHDFSGNFWSPANCSNTNVNKLSPLASCPLTTNSCYAGGPTTAVPGGFNAFESSTAAGAITGIIKTKIAGQAFSLDVIALNTAKSAVQTAFSGDVKIEVVNNTNGSAIDTTTNCPSTSTTLSTQTVTFASSDAGRKSVSFAAIGNVWRNARIRLTYPASGTATTIVCSTDNFAIRPYQFTNVIASDATWTTAGGTRILNNVSSSGGNVHKAGQPFTLTVTAVDANGNAVSNYAGSPTVKSIACTLPSPTCVNGVVIPGSWTSNGAGTVSTGNAAYSEAGSFNLLLEDTTFASVDVDASNSNTAEYTVPQSAGISVGRFVPDHFTLTASTVPQYRTYNTTDLSCSASGHRLFTYVGQAFGWVVTPQAQVTAQNAANGTTANYKGSLWKLTASAVTASYAASYQDTNGAALMLAGAPFDTSGQGVPTVASNDNGLGTITSNAAETFKFQRNAVVQPFKGIISLTLSVTDSTETGANQTGGIASTVPLLFNGGGSGIAFDSQDPVKGHVFRYGRLKINNAIGSELLALPVGISAQYWDGGKFVTNTDDYCASVGPANIVLAPGTGGTINTSILTGSGFNTPLSGGVGRIVLAKPTGFTSRGSVKLSVSSSSSLYAYLPGADPYALAAFGVYRNNAVIYLREMY